MLIYRKVRWRTISKQGLRINGGIKASVVRLIDGSNNQVGIVDRDEALAMAREAGLDLVEVAPTSDPPVCRLMDYGKWLYEQKRKTRDAHKKNLRHTAILKEIRLRPETDTRDLEIKVKHGREFLEKATKYNSQCSSGGVKCCIEITVMPYSIKLPNQWRIWQKSSDRREWPEDVSLFYLYPKRPYLLKKTRIKKVLKSVFSMQTY